MTDVTTKTIGKVLDETARRDAVHIALAPMIAAEHLCPGQHVGMRSDGYASSLQASERIGIVDPFLPGRISPGDRFWVWLYPMTITSLRHEWEHPAFGAEAEVVDAKAASEAWLREFVKTEVGYVEDEEEVDEAYRAFLGAALEEPDWLNGTSYITVRGYDAKSYIPNEFWDHVEVVTGRKIPDRKRAAQFTCSC